MRSSPGLAGTLLVLMVLPGIGTASAQESRPVDVRLDLEPGFVVNNTTLLVGHIRIGTERYQHPSVVDATRLDLGAGVLTACPSGRGARESFLDALAFDEACDGAETHRHPDVTFGTRTWLRFVGNHTPAAPPPAALGMIVPEGPFDAPLWAHVPSSQVFDASYADDLLRFVPLSTDAKVNVASSSGEAEYRGPDWVFLFNGSRAFSAHGRAMSVTVDERFTVDLGPADAEAVRPTLEPRALLDVQELELGGEGREALANITRHFAQARNAHLLAAAAVGRWNGTVGQIDLRNETNALVRFTTWNATYENSTLHGPAGVRFALFGTQVSVAARGPVGAPLLLPLILWIIAFVAFALGRAWPPRPRWLTILERSLYVVGFVVWDRIIHGVFGVSGLDMFGAPTVPNTLALLVFEVVAWTLAWLLLFFPLRVVGRRVLPLKVRPFVAPAALVLVLLYAILWTDRVIALGTLVAQF